MVKAFSDTGRGDIDPQPAATLLNTADAPERTSERLLDAAQRLFAQRGYAGASVRDITALAGTNIASVNYHFGGKESLYVAVFDRMITELREERLRAVRGVLKQAEEARDVALIVRAFSEAFLRPLADPERASDMLSLYLAEIASPQLPPGLFMQEMVEPTERVMIDALRRTCPGLDREAASMCFHALIGQLVHLVQFWQLTKRETQAPVAFDFDRHVAHIVRFTTAGIAASCGGGA
jgi:AcrR family transcriptional regulator